MTEARDIPWRISSTEFDEIWAQAYAEKYPEGRVLPDGGRADVPDMLATMMAQQTQHMVHYCDPQGQKPDSLQIPLDLDLVGRWDTRQVHESFRRTMGWCAEEIFEAVGLFKGKPWKTHFPVPDYDAVMDEIGDALHFFLEACLVLGLRPEDLFKAYFKASLKNVQRQKGSY